ncbi:MAG: hypothetical protein ACXW19_06800 [Thermoanaerobaculia bacterium]
MATSRTVLIGAIISGCLATARCAPLPEKGDLNAKPPALIVLERGENVDYRIGDGVHAVVYSVTIPYPAEAAINQIADQVANAGFRPLREHPMNPGLPSAFVRGWSDFIDGTRKPEMRVYQWIADWVGPNGEWLEYALSFEYPEGSSPDLRTLKVSAALMPKGHARAAIAAAANKNRAETFGSLVLPASTRPAVKRAAP